MKDEQTEIREWGAYYLLTRYRIRTPGGSSLFFGIFLLLMGYILPPLLAIGVLVLVRDRWVFLIQRRLALAVGRLLQKEALTTSRPETITLPTEQLTTHLDEEQPRLLKKKSVILHRRVVDI